MSNKATAIVAKVLTTVFCIAASSAVWSAQHDFLTAGGVDDANVANAYYQTIDPTNLRTTQNDWLEVNGYNDPVNQVVVAKGHFNNGDLGLWRSVSMVVDKRAGKEGNIAFTTGNYNTETDALNEANAVSIVNMEYSQGPEDDKITKFYVFDVNTGARVTSTVFDNTGAQLHLPAACYSCHGGDDDAEGLLPDGYNEGSGETNATFIPLEVSTMSFGNTSLASLEASFKQLNEAILETDPTKATRKLIKGLYGGSDLPRNTQDLNYVPASWATETQLYLDVVVPACRNCHTASDKKILNLSWWKDNPGKIREEVFHEKTMPNSKPGFDRFWSTNQNVILLDALNRFEFP